MASPIYLFQMIKDGKTAVFGNRTLKQNVHWLDLRGFGANTSPFPTHDRDPEQRLLSNTTEVEIEFDAKAEKACQDLFFAQAKQTLFDIAFIDSFRGEQHDWFQRLQINKPMVIGIVQR